MLTFKSVGFPTENGYFQSRELTTLEPQGAEQVLLSLSAVNGQVYHANYPSPALADLWSEHPFFADPWLPESQLASSFMTLESMPAC